MLNTILPVSQIDISGVDKKMAYYLANMYLSHRFDLLGSGWVKNSYDSKSMGVEGYKYDMNVTYDLAGILPPDYLEYAKQITRLIDADYEPIDWQKDYKCGYRWNQKHPCQEQKFGHQNGVDIKVPWELARMQHLPAMAMFSLAVPDLKERCIKEFRNEVLDFIATNPPAMGANWTCPMDVGIRVANILVAYDLFSQIDKKSVSDDNFKEVVTKSMYQHGRHLRDNLEVHEVAGKSNHYLSDIAGILFVAAYLPCDDEVDEWLHFAVDEMLIEIQKQFFDDGADFECSTMYHRLAGELAVYSIALIWGLTNEKIAALKTFKSAYNLYEISDNKINLSQSIIDRLFRIGIYMTHVTKPTDEIPQIGDGDSGRFFILTHIGSFLTNSEAEEKYQNLKGYNDCIKSYSANDEIYWDESFLDCSAFVAAVGGLFDNQAFQNNIKLEKSFIRALSKNCKLLPEDTNLKLSVIRREYPFKLAFCKEIIIKPGKQNKNPLSQNLQLLTYPDVGVYIFKSDRLHLTISAGGNGHHGYGGHSHNDKLSFELNLDLEDIVVDAGTYLYTPLYERRGEFRSVKAHNTIIIDGQEQNNWLEELDGAFNLFDESRVHIMKCVKDEFKAFLTYRDNMHIRSIKIYDDKIIITDCANKEFEQNFASVYSNGYGKLLRAKPNQKVKTFEFRNVEGS